MDTLSPAERAKRMGLVKSRDTKPEMRVRRLVHALGYRYRLHDRKLSGHPDLVFKSRRKVLFVNGCFWHRHPGCPLTRTPKTRIEFWESKFADNEKRDKQVWGTLRELGWEVAVVWECETMHEPLLHQRIQELLGDGTTNIG